MPQQPSNKAARANAARANILDVARHYLQRGWKPLPIPTARKRPNDQDWQATEITLDNVGRHFQVWDLNIGLQFGPPSGLCDIDLDCAEARVLAQYFLPGTGAVFGRHSAPSSHWLYCSDAWEAAARAATPFCDPVKPTGDDNEHGVMLLELRTGRKDNKGAVKGALSLAPPSRHPSGEAVRWDHDGEPATVGGGELNRAVAMLAAATLLLRHYPTQGQRHEAFLVIGGWLARAGWDEEAIAKFVKPVAEAASDLEAPDRIGTAKGAVRKLAEGDKVPGRPRMVEMFGDRIVKALGDWLDIEGSAPAVEQPKPAAAVAVRRATPPCAIDVVIERFRHWLKLEDVTPVHAALGAIAANKLPGDPVWLGLVAPPSYAKTEFLNATALLDGVVQSATLTLAALLSGTPHKQRARDAKGGVLRLIGEHGILVLKDFSSILSMRPDAKAEVLAALREIYDGRWVRHLGTDGGRTLEWSGKMGLLFGATESIDDHYSVISAMGDRFILCRLKIENDGRGLLHQALKHKGEETRVMRNELAEVVAGLFASELPEPRDLSDQEERRLDKLVRLAVRLRGHVERDRVSKEITAVHGAEGTPRLGMMLERLLAGLDSIGVARDVAFKVVEKISLDSVPPQRLAAYQYLRWERNCQTTDTTKVATALGLPSRTARWRLEELAAHGVCERISRGAGHADLWRTWKWGGLDR